MKLGYIILIHFFTSQTLQGSPVTKVIIDENQTIIGNEQLLTLTICVLYSQKADFSGGCYPLIMSFAYCSTVR